MRSVKTLFAAFVCMILVVFGYTCSKKSVGSAEEQPVVVQAFSPPVDSVITPEQFVLWLNCCKPLDSLSRVFADLKTLKTSSPTDSIHNIFFRSQDSVCARYGLIGGYRHYLWIRDNAGTVRNRHLFDSARSPR